MDASMGSKDSLDAQQTRMSVISNNLANVNTTGFKRDRATFEIFYIRLFVALEDKQRLTLKHQQDLCWEQEPEFYQPKKFMLREILYKHKMLWIWRLMVKVFSKYYNQTAP